MWDDSEWDDNAPIVAPKPFTVGRFKTGCNNSNDNHDAGNNWRDNNSSGSGRDRDYSGNRRDDRRNFRGSNSRQQRNGGDNFEGNGGGGRNNRQENQTPTIMKVPSKFVGRIIGRGGAKISDLQYESGARINVTKETEADFTIVKIFGDEHSIQTAQNLIEDLTVEREALAAAQSQPKQTEEKKITAGEFMKRFDNWDDFIKETQRLELEKWENFPKIKKHFYEEHPDIKNMSEQEVEQFRLESNNIVVERTFNEEGDSAGPIPKPVVTFEQAFHNYPAVLEEIRKVGFEKPSPIQSQAWPILLSGEDMIGIAQTGTGKTLAFLLPCLIHIDGQGMTREERGGPAGLVMAPTRELALQIEREVRKYEYKGINAVCIYGGADKREQIRKVQQGVDIVIATPGRLNDLVSAGHLNVETFTYCVLDEADRMLDMGFEPQIRRVMYAVNPNRQTVMTSATWPSGVRRLAKSYMQNPIQVYVGSLDLAATHTVRQTILILPDDEAEKEQTFMDFVNQLQPDEKVIVFCGKKARADNLSSDLSLKGIYCATIHGDREQCDREQALADITDGSVQVLVATDVASRGLDIEDVTHVVNYDFPRNIEEYVHRVGRTGRAGKTGESISYFTRADWAQAQELISILQEAEQHVPEELFGMAERYAAWKERKESQERSGQGRRGGGRFGGGGGGGRRW